LQPPCWMLAAAVPSSFGTRVHGCRNRGVP
jgi:hypothetical protein